MSTQRSKIQNFQNVYKEMLNLSNNQRYGINTAMRKHFTFGETGVLKPCWYRHLKTQTYSRERDCPLPHYFLEQGVVVNQGNHY